jgi:hypothetical protein
MLNHNYIGTEHILLVLRDHQGDDVTGEGAPLPDDALTRVDSLDRRPAAIDGQDFELSAALHDKERQLLAARAGVDRGRCRRMPVAQELGRVKVELERLRAFCAITTSRRVTTLHRRPTRAISRMPGYRNDGGHLQFGGWTRRYDLAPLGPVRD